MNTQRHPHSPTLSTANDAGPDPIAVALRAYGQEPCPEGLQDQILNSVTAEAAIGSAWPARWLFAVPVLQVAAAVLAAVTFQAVTPDPSGRTRILPPRCSRAAYATASLMASIA